MERLFQKESGKDILLGNEAIVRGALESGVQFVSTYPGTPASDIGDLFFKLSREKNNLAKSFYFEYSVNEKVALEAGIGASFSCLKTLVAMKNFGLNVCQDALLPLLYAGTKGPMVIVVADDPECHSSAQSEENSRAISYLAHIPTLEPSDPQEAKDFIELGFKLSERYKLPIMVRTTTRVAHQRAIVKLNALPKSNLSKGNFIKDKAQFVTMPPRVLEMKRELLEKIEKIRERAEGNKELIRSGRTKDIGIVVSGVAYLYVLEALKELDIDLPILKIGMFYPLAEKTIKNFIKDKKKVLVVEELEPWLEKEVERLTREVNPKLEIFGKDLLPEVGELKPESVLSAIAKMLNKKLDKNFKFQSANWRTNFKLSRRSPQPCAGCPYWFVFNAIKRAVNIKKVIFGGDIGCYMLAGSPVIDLQDYLSCMGSSIGIGHGIKKSSQQKLIAFIGDSTFFHAGIPALINTVINKSNPLIFILDNRTTAMTGHQPSPGTKIEIEGIVKACGVKNVKTINPLKQKELIATIKDFMNKKDVSVIISRYPCIFVK